MKRIHIRKPDIKGFFVKIKNLKREDIKRHFQEKRSGASVSLKSGAAAAVRRRCSRSISG